MSPEEFLTENEETSFRKRLAKALALYLPFGDNLARLFISTESDLKASSTQAPDDKLSKAFSEKQRQGFIRFLVPLFSGIIVGLGVVIAVALLTTNPVGWAILAGLAAGMLTTGVVYGITLSIQKLRNKWNSRVKIALTKNLTEEKVQRIIHEMDFQGNSNNLKAKFDAIDKSSLILTQSDMRNLCENLTHEQQLKLRAKLGLNSEEVKNLREKLGIPKGSLFYLRWASGDSDPLANPMIVDPQYGAVSKRFTKEKIGATIGTVLGAIIGCAGVFFGLPLMGFDLTLVTVPVQVAVLIGTSILGTYLGRDVGADFNYHEQTTPEKNFAELEEKNHPGRWKIYRLMRNVIAALSFSSFMMAPKFVVYFAEQAKDWAIFFAYGIAGFISGGVRFNKKSAGPAQNLTTSFDPSKYTTKTNIIENKDKELLKLFWLERYFKYKTKLDHSRISDTIAHGIFWNIRYIYESLVSMTWDPYYTQSKGLQRLAWTFQGIFFGIPALALGVAKSVIEAALLLPVVNHVWSATQSIFIPNKDTPKVLQPWYAALFRFFYHLSPVPTYAKVIEADKPSHPLYWAYATIIKAPALYIMNILSVGKNSYSDQRAVYLARHLEAEMMLKDLANGNSEQANIKRNEHLQTYVTKAEEREKHTPTPQTAPSSFPAGQAKRLITRSWSRFFSGPGSDDDSKREKRLLKTGEQDPRNKVTRYAEHYAPLPSPAASTPT